MSSQFQAATMWRAIGLVVLLVLAWRLRMTAMLVFGAVLFAAALRGLAAPLASCCRMGERWATATVVVSLALLSAGVLWLVGGPLSEQLADLRHQLPQAWEALRGWLVGQPLGERLLQFGSELSLAELPWSNIALLATGTMHALGAMALIALLGLYLASDPHTYRDGLVRLVPPRHRDQARGALDAAGEALTRWLLGQLVTMAAMGVAVAVGLWWLGMPMALALALICGLLEFIPFLGPIFSGALAVLVAFAQGPQQALWVGLLFFALQQVEGNLLVPLIQRWAVHLPPALAVGAVLVFGTLFGWAGVIFGTPLMVLTMVMVRRLYVETWLEGMAGVDTAASSLR